MDKRKLLVKEIIKLHPESRFDVITAIQWLDAMEGFKTKSEFMTKHDTMDVQIRKDIMDIGWDIHTGVYNCKLYKALK